MSLRTSQQDWRIWNHMASSSWFTPDFTARLKSSAPMNERDRSAYYAGGAQAYTDYPTLAEKAVA